jgi:release factor glutamine methyltransferase
VHDLSSIVDALRRAGCVFAEEEAQLLVEAAASPEQLAALVARRVEGEPLEQILGWAEFYGLRVAVRPGVFVPRRRTELLVRVAAGLAVEGAIVVDLCCGSGAIGAALRSAVPRIELHAADVDPAAVACARANLVGALVWEGDLYQALPHDLRGRIDVLAVNAPYVPTDAVALMPPEARDHEHRVALDGGRDGLEVVRRVALGATEWLVPGGHLLIETSVAQAPLVAEIFAHNGLSAVVHHDDDIAGTVVVGCGIPGLL